MEADLVFGLGKALTQQRRGREGGHLDQAGEDRQDRLAVEARSSVAHPVEVHKDQDLIVVEEQLASTGE